MASVRDVKCSEPSLCIPRVFSNITEGLVEQVMDQLELGTIDRIDMVERESYNGDLYQRVFIHFKEWNGMHTEGGRVRQRLLDGEEIKIVYDDPWFWKVSASRSRRPRAQKEYQRPRIEFCGAPPHKEKRVQNHKDLQSVQQKRSERFSYAAAAGAPSRAAAAAASGMCGDAIMAAQHEEEDELNAGLSVEAADDLCEKMSKLSLKDSPPEPSSPLKRSWGSA